MYDVAGSGRNYSPGGCRLTLETRVDNAVDDADMCGRKCFTWPSWTVPKSLWLKQNRPELFAAAPKICEYQAKPCTMHVSQLKFSTLER